nr:L-lactate dehydrogenase B-like [Ipomoea batatas]
MHKSSSSSSFGPGGLDLSQTFFKPIPNAAPPSPTKRHTKVSVVGVGNVGMAIAQTVLTQDLADELALVDAMADKVRGEMLDLQHAAAFLPRTKIHASVDYAVTAGSDLVIVTAGARQNPGESRLGLIERNCALFKKIIPQLVKYSRYCILMIVSNPVDILTYVAWKLSGFPANRVIGSGTNLDSSRFRFLIADHLDVNAQDVQAYIQWGARGTIQWHLWSSMKHRRVPVLSFLERLQIAYEKSVREHPPRTWVHSAYEVIRSNNGYTSWPLATPWQTWLVLTKSYEHRAYIVGEHGDSSVALWSSISIGGVPVLSFLERQQIAYEKEALENIHRDVVHSAYEVISLKGYTSWAIGYSVANLARSLLRDQRRVHPVSVLARGFYGIDGGDVFLSLPAQLGRSGVLGVTNVHLSEEEERRLQASAKTILEVQRQLGV